MDLLGTLRDIAKTGGSSALDGRTDRSRLRGGRIPQRMELSERRREREVGQDHAEPGVVPDSLGLLVEHRGERAQARKPRVQVLPGFERMARADEVRQPVVGAIHLADDIRARPQVEVDEAVAPELIGECRIDELCDVVVEPRGCAQRGAIEFRQLRECRRDGRGDGPRSIATSDRRADCAATHSCRCRARDRSPLPGCVGGVPLRDAAAARRAPRLPRQLHSLRRKSAQRR